MLGSVAVMGGWSVGVGVSRETRGWLVSCRSGCTLRCKGASALGTVMVPSSGLGQVVGLRGGGGHEGAGRGVSPRATHTFPSLPAEVLTSAW